MTDVYFGIIWIIPICIYYVGRLVWWIWFSPRNYEVDIQNEQCVCLILTFWPIALVLSIPLGVIYLFCLGVEKLRENRLKKQER